MLIEIVYFLSLPVLLYFGKKQLLVNQDQGAFSKLLTNMSGGMIRLG